jgi:hypothetical protein
MKFASGNGLRLRHLLRFAQVIHLTGRIEMANGAEPNLPTVFKDVGDQLEETATNLNGLKNLLQRSGSSPGARAITRRTGRTAIAQIDAQMNGPAGISL